MRKLKSPIMLFCLLLVVITCTVSAHAALPQVTFVSATGSDSNACSQTSPCATFQGALNKTAIGGEIDALTAGNFEGPDGLVINNSITIDGKGLASVSLNSEQAIAVNEYATTDTVILRGLLITGGNSAVEGIYYPSGGSLIVENCTVAGFTYNGIVNVTNGTSLLYVKNTTINGGATGIYVNEDTGTTILDHVTIAGASTYGIEVLNSPGFLTVTDSTIVGGSYGVDIQSSAYYGSSVFDTVLERTTITGTTTVAIYAGVGATDVDSSTIFNNPLAMQAAGGSIKISNNNLYNNTNGIFCTSASSTVVSQGNNRHGSGVGYVASGGCKALGELNLE